MCVMERPYPWVEVTEDVGEGLARELELEIPPGHILEDHIRPGKQYQVVARRRGNDDILVRCGEGEQAIYAVVHLTWVGRQERRPQWPFAILYSNYQDWIDRCLIPDMVPDSQEGRAPSEVGHD